MVQPATARRALARDRFVAGLSIFVLLAMVGYMLVGDRPFNPDLLAAAKISPINRWMWIGLFCFSVPVLWLRRAELPGLAAAIWPILVLFGWFVLTTAWALDPVASTRRALLTCLTLVIVVAVTLGLRWPARVHLWLCVPCILVVGIDLLSWAAVPGLANTPLGLQGMHAQKNMLGQYSMYTLIAVGTCLCARHGPWVRRFLLVGGLVAGMTLLASRSATSIGLTLGAAIILPALVLLLRQRGVVIAAWLLALLALAGLGAAGYLAWAGAVGADPLAPLAGVTFTRRTDLWAFLIENIEKRPWGGSGYGSFWSIDRAVQPSLNSGLWFGSGRTIAPEGHNAYLDLAATTGLIGAGLGLLVLVRAVVQAARAVHQTRPALPRATSAFHLGFMLMVMGHSMTESTLFTPDSPLGTLFILAAVAVARAAGGSPDGSTNRAAPAGRAHRRSGHRQ